MYFAVGEHETKKLDQDFFLNSSAFKASPYALTAESLPSAFGQMPRGTSAFHPIFAGLRGATFNSNFPLNYQSILKRRKSESNLPIHSQSLLPYFNSSHCIPSFPSIPTNFGLHGGPSTSGLLNPSSFDSSSLLSELTTSACSNPQDSEIPFLSKKWCFNELLRDAAGPATYSGKFQCSSQPLHEPDQNSLNLTTTSNTN